MICVKIPKTENGKPLAHYLRENGYTLPMPCGGSGRCGNCRVKVTQGVFSDVESPHNPLIPDENGMIRACRALCPLEGGTVEIPEFSGQGMNADFANHKNEKPDSPASYGLALDVGSTTLVLQLTNLQTGECEGRVSRLNPQQAYGADVMTRIEACQKGLLEEMRRGLLRVVEEMIRDVCCASTAGSDDLPLTVAGNTVMQHIFMGESPCGMASYPFTPSFLQTRHTLGREIGLPCGEITVLPGCSAFIGADITAGLVACGMAKDYQNGSSRIELLTDWGTNGETVLLANGRLYGASAAAGPAMEGGHIHCGVGGITGAVNRIFITDENKLCYTTVGDGDPVGICSSGLMDLLRILLQNGTVDESGFLEPDPYPLVGCRKIGDTLLEPAPTGLCLTGKDVRELQLAKAAIRGAEEALLAEAGITEDEVQRVYLAGGIGKFLSVDSAVAMGLLPAIWKNRTEVVGNSALTGAVHYSLHGEDEPLYRLAAENTETVDLNSSVVFNQRFIENMMF